MRRRRGRSRNGRGRRSRSNRYRCAGLRRDRRGLTLRDIDSGPARSGATNANHAIRDRNGRAGRVDRNRELGAFDAGDEIGRDHLEMNLGALFDSEQDAADGLADRRSDSSGLDRRELGGRPAGKRHEIGAASQGETRAGRGSEFARGLDFADRAERSPRLGSTGADFDETDSLGNAPWRWRAYRLGDNDRGRANRHILGKYRPCREPTETRNKRENCCLQLRLWSPLELNAPDAFEKSRRRKHDHALLRSSGSGCLVDLFSYSYAFMLAHSPQVFL